MQSHLTQSTTGVRQGFDTCPCYEILQLTLPHFIFFLTFSCYSQGLYLHPLIWYRLVSGGDRIIGQLLEQSELHFIVEQFAKWTLVSHRKD